MDPYLIHQQEMTDKKQISERIGKNGVRCSYCKKKSIYLSNCKCGSKFCIKHIRSEEHDCTYDYKNERKLEESAQFKKVDLI